VSKDEARELRAFARLIEELDLPTLDKETKSRIATDIGFGYHPYRKTFARSWEGAIAVLVVMVLVFAQSAKPGSALYAIKRGTDKVRTAVTHNVPLLNRFDDSPRHNDSSGKDDTNSNDSRQGSSNDSSSTDDSTKTGGVDTSSSSGKSSGTDDSSAQGPLGSGSSDSNSDSSGSGSSSPSASGGSGDSGSSGSSPNSGKDQSKIKVEDPIQSQLE
jgi:hypothetical protein